MKVNYLKGDIFTVVLSVEEEQRVADITVR